MRANHPDSSSERPRRSVRSAVVACVVAFCSACAAPAESTETGNPPLVAANRSKIDVRSEDGVVNVVGASGAVEPANARVIVTHVADGKRAAVDAERDGSFAVQVAGSVADEYTVEVRANGETTELTLPVPAPPEASERTAEQACQKICAGPGQCAARETLFPVTGCDCDQGVCDCAPDECVAACLSDLDGFRAQGPACGAAVDALHQCFIAAPCAVLASRDQAVIAQVPECSGVIDPFEDSCHFGSAETCFTKSNGALVDASTLQVLHCDFNAQCGTTNYSLDCTLTDPDTTDYLCTCREDGGKRASFPAQAACSSADPVDADRDADLRYLSFRCGWDLPTSANTLDTSTCSNAKYTAGTDESPGACTLEASCGEVDYTVECKGGEEGVSCACLKGDELVATAELDSEGCLGARSLSGDEPGESDVLLALRSICAW